MLGLLLWFEDSGDRRAFACARAIADLVCARFLKTGTAIVDLSYKYSTEMNHAMLHGLAVLHRITGTDAYLRMAEAIVDELRLRDRDGVQAGDYVRRALAGTEFHRTPRPRWESLHALMGLAELSSITGNPDYRTTVERFWWSIVEHDRHNNGGFSSGEGAVGNPYHPGSIETCCTVAWIAYSVEMLRLTGSSIVADEIELSTLNQVVGYQFRDGGPCTYDTPMDGRRVSAVEHVQWQRRPGSEQMICCTANGPRGFGMISDWALMRDGDGLVLNWYGPSTIAVRVGETAVTLTQETEYPRDGRVTLTVDPDAPLACALKLRIPYWSAATAVAVNGNAVSPVTPGSYSHPGPDVACRRRGRARSGPVAPLLDRRAGVRWQGLRVRRPAAHGAARRPGRGRARARPRRRADRPCPAQPPGVHAGRPVSGGAAAAGCVAGRTRGTYDHARGFRDGGGWRRRVPELAPHAHRVLGSLLEEQPRTNLAALTTWQHKNASESPSSAPASAGATSACRPYA